MHSLSIGEHRAPPIIHFYPQAMGIPRILYVLNRSSAQHAVSGSEAHFLSCS